MVYLSSSSAELTVEGLRIIKQDIISAQETSYDTEQTLSKLQTLAETYKNLLDSLSKANAFWNVTDKQATTWSMQTYSRTYGKVKLELRKKNAAFKPSLDELQGLHMKLLSMVSKLGSDGFVKLDVPEDQLFKPAVAT